MAPAWSPAVVLDSLSITYSWFNGGFNETQLLHGRDHTGGSWLTLIVPDSFRTMQLQGIPRLSVSRRWALCGRPPYLLCLWSPQSACTCVETCQTEHLKDVHRCPRVHPAGSPFGFCFMSIYYINVWNQAHSFKTQTIQSDEVWPSVLHFQMCCNTVLLFYGECPHLISDSRENLGLIPSQVFSMEFACSPMTLGFPWVLQYWEGKSPPPLPIRNKQW